MQALQAQLLMLLAMADLLTDLVDRQMATLVATRATLLLHDRETIAAVVLLETSTPIVFELVMLQHAHTHTFEQVRALVENHCVKMLDESIARRSPNTKPPQVA